MMSRLEKTSPGFIRDGERHTDALIVLLQNLSKLHVRLHRQKIIEQNFNPPSSSGQETSSSNRGRKSASSSSNKSVKKKSSKSSSKNKKSSNVSAKTSSSTRQRGSRVAHIIKALKLVDRSLLKGIRLLTPRALALSNRRVDFFRILCSLLRKSNSSNLISAVLIGMNRWVRSSAECRLQDKLKRHEEVANSVPSRVRSEILGLSQTAEGMPGMFSSNERDAASVLKDSRGFKPLSHTEIYGFALSLFASRRLMDDHPSLHEDFLKLTVNLVAEYDREGDEVPKTLIDCATYGLLSGESKSRETFRTMLLFGDNLGSSSSTIVVREMKHEISRKLRVLFRFDWSMLSRQYFLSVILDEMLRSVRAERGAGDGDSTVLHIRVGDVKDNIKIKVERGFLLLKQAQTLSNRGVTDESVIPALRHMIYASPQLCHRIFSELFPVVWSNLPRCDREALSNDLVAFLSRSWHENQPRGFLNVAKSVFSALPEDVLLRLPIELIAHLGRRHNCWFVSIKALESILEHARDQLSEKETSISDQDVVKHRVLETARHLESLYDELNMKDLAFAVRRSYAQSKTSKIGLTMETYGYIQEAHEIYAAAIQDASSLSLEKDDAVILEEERVLWEKRWVTCSKQLLRWETLSQFAKSTYFFYLLCLVCSPTDQRSNTITNTNTQTQAHRTINFDWTVR